MYVDSALEEEIIIKAIAEKEGISMTDEEVMAEMEKTAMSNGLSLEDFQAYFGVDVDSFRSYAFEIKVLNTLSALTTFEEEEETEADIYYPGTEADDEWTEYVADLLDSTEAETETEA
jgi:FKBP-type peptidyl-prolyl cis-trans isomerase (trigger factor)